MTTENGTIGRYLGWFLAALSAAAGAIHFANAGEHFDLTWYHGTFFAVVAWLQLSWAAAAVVKPTRPLLMLAVVINAAVIGTWIVSRTAGIPFGPGKNEAEDIALADGLATGFEAGIVLLSLVVLLRPAFAQRNIAPRVGLAGLGTTSLAIAVVSSVALTPSFASDHSHPDDGHSETAAAEGHAHGESAEDMNMSEEEHAAAGHDAESGHDMGDAGGAYAIKADGTSPCEESGVQAEGQTSGHGHRGPYEHVQLTGEELVAFQDQVAAADAVVAANPTVEAAEANGYGLITQYVPCIGAHYIKYSNFSDGFDPANPEVILFDGQEPDSKVVGLSYLQLGDPENEPEGFVGPNDHWHIHNVLCRNPNAGIVGDGISDEECERRGGQNMDTARVWMMHMWNVPGWESNWGLFSSEHPGLGGTFRNIDG